MTQTSSNVVWRALPWHVTHLPKHPKFGIVTDSRVIVGKAWTAEDAKLFASAPDLYATLECLLWRFNEMVVEAGGNPANQSEAILAREALAKARGEQS
jgi:hypothetical protein